MGGCTNLAQGASMAITRAALLYLKLEAQFLSVTMFCQRNKKNVSYVCGGTPVEVGPRNGLRERWHDQ